MDSNFKSIYRVMFNNEYRVHVVTVTREDGFNCINFWSILGSAWVAWRD